MIDFLDKQDVLCLDKAYSTTRRLTRTKPVIEIDTDSHLNVRRALFSQLHSKQKGVGGLRTQGYFKAGGYFEQSRPCTGRSSAKWRPLVTVITVALNEANTLERTILSVINQSYENIEYIVIDGGSTDGTIDILRKYENSIDYWICEPDGGISDAFNKGIGLSTGEYHAIINANDWYEDDSIINLVDGLEPGCNQVVICAVTRVMDEKGKFIKFYRSMPGKLWTKMSLAHNSCLANTSAVIEVGGYSKNKQIAMDHHLMLRLLLKFGIGDFKFVNKCVANFHLGGLSDKHIKDGFREVRDNLVANGVPSIIANSRYIVLVLKHIVSSILLRILSKR